jgi:hypothetical protein
MEIDIANIISAAGTLLAAYFAYNQYTKNKLTDLKVEYFKKEEERRSYHRSENSAKVFGELWRVLYETKADRVYIVQPHPLGHIAFLSVQFEVKRKGIAGMRENIQSLPMSEVAVFAENVDISDAAETIRAETNSVISSTVTCRSLPFLSTALKPTIFSKFKSLIISKFYKVLI